MDDTVVRRVCVIFGIVAAVLSILWFVTFQAKDVIAPVQDWRDVEAYAAALSPWRTLYIYPSLLLAQLVNAVGRRRTACSGRATPC